MKIKKKERKMMKSEAQKRWEEKNALSGFDFFVLVERKNGMRGTVK